MKLLIVEIEIEDRDSQTDLTAIEVVNKWLADMSDADEDCERVQITKLIRNNDPMLKPVQHPSYDPYH